MVIRKDLFGHADKDVPILCDWDLFEKSPDTYYNTPAAFPMYMTGLYVSYMNQMGGLEYYEQITNIKSKMLWDMIDNSDGYYKSKITQKEYRSRVNVIFRIQNGNVKLEKTFVELAKKAGITQIVAHSFNPGIRISMYNGMPVTGVGHLCNFMRVFMLDFPFDRVREDPKM